MATPGTPATPAWSFTRDQMLRSCRRRYYYHYHLAPAGSHPGALPLARRAYMLKHLVTLDLVLGIAVHRAAQVLAHAVHAGGQLPASNALWSSVRRALNAACASSRDRDAFARAPNRHTMLREVFYGTGITPRAVERVREKAVLCLENLCRAPLWDALRGLRRDEIQAFDTPVRFTVRGVDAWAAPDLVFRAPRGHRVVVDWKTGKDDKKGEQEQVSAYGLFLRSSASSPDPADLEAKLIHLRTGEETDYLLTDAHLGEAEARILEGARAMQECSGILERLGPGAVEAFPLAAYRGQCPRCNFFELCSEELRGCLSRPVPVPAGRSA